MTVVRALLARVQRLESAIVASTFSFVLLAMVATPTAAQTAKHPLDGLTAQEYWAVYETMKASGHVDSKSRFPIMSLREPPKEEVLAWKAGQPFRREALVVVKQGPSTFEAVVDITGRRITSWKDVEGVQPNLTEEDNSGVFDAVKADAQWQAAMRRRRITDFDTIRCVGISSGYFGTQEEQGRRILRVTCQDLRGVWEPWGRPIEGLSVVWDANDRKVLRVIDTEVVPVPRAPTNFDIASVGPLREIPTPISMQQPFGPSFRLDGNDVSWQKWNFHFRIDRRLGLVVSNLRYADGDKPRSILHEGSLSEIFVPYMDPSEPWNHWTYFDAGESADGFSSSLEPGADCPENSVYFDQVYANEKGIPQQRPRAACFIRALCGRHCVAPFGQRRRHREQKAA